MSRVSLPGLFLSAVVVVAALLALLALEFDGSAPGQYQSPPESDAIMRLSEARGAVKGRSDSSAAQRRRALQRRAGRVAVDGFLDGIARRLQPVGHQVAHDPVVVNDQDLAVFSLLVAQAPISPNANCV